jgi:hypothetical protein
MRSDSEADFGGADNTSKAHCTEITVRSEASEVCEACEVCYPVLHRRKLVFSSLEMFIV